jgi:hypothetical protein
MPKQTPKKYLYTVKVFLCHSSGDKPAVRALYSRQLCEKAAQLGPRFELRHRIKLLEGADESIRQAPHGSGRELRIFRLEMQPMDLGQ